MKPVIALVAMAALCALATAAPLGSQPELFRPTHLVAPLLEIPFDPDLDAPYLAWDEMAGTRGEAARAISSPVSSAPKVFVPVALSAATLLALGSVFFVTCRNLRTRPGRRKRLEYSSRTMASLI